MGPTSRPCRRTRSARAATRIRTRSASRPSSARICSGAAATTTRRSPRRPTAATPGARRARLINVPGERPYVEVRLRRHRHDPRRLHERPPERGRRRQHLLRRIPRRRLRRPTARRSARSRHHSRRPPPTLVYDGPRTPGSTTWRTTHEGRPVIVFARFPAHGRPPVHVRALDRRASGQCTRSPPPAARSATTAARSSTTAAASRSTTRTRRTVYLSRRVDGVFEVETWTTPDGGASWDEPRAITAGSSIKNVRPVSPTRADAVLGATCRHLDARRLHQLPRLPHLDHHDPAHRRQRATGRRRRRSSPRTGPAPQAVAFDGARRATPTGTIAAYHWDFGDGEQATGAQVRHVYGRPGPLLPAPHGHRRRRPHADVAVEEVQIGPFEAPLVRTGPATEVGDGVVTLNGSIDPRNQPRDLPVRVRPDDGVRGGDTPSRWSRPSPAAAPSPPRSPGSSPARATTTGSSPPTRRADRRRGPRVHRGNAGRERLPRGGPRHARARRLLAARRSHRERGRRPARRASPAPTRACVAGEEGALPSDPDTSAGFDGIAGEMTAAGPALADGRGTLEGWFDWRGRRRRDARPHLDSGRGLDPRLHSTGRLFYRVGGVNFNDRRTVASVRAAGTTWP